MPETNRISLKIADIDLQDIRKALEVLKSKLLPQLKTLSVQERKELSKMGDRSFPFVQKAWEYGQKTPAIVPAFVDMAEFTNDVAAVTLLRDLNQELEVIKTSVEDSLTLAGHEAYAAALLLYGGSKTAAKAGISGAEAAANDLSVRFAGQSNAAAAQKKSS